MQCFREDGAVLLRYKITTAQKFLNKHSICAVFENAADKTLYFLSSTTLQKLQVLA